MRPQFGIRALLCGTAVAGIWLGAVLFEHHFISARTSGYSFGPYVRDYLGILSIALPILAPLVVLSYAAGRRTLTAWTVTAVAIVEAVALVAVTFLLVR